MMEDVCIELNIIFRVLVDIGDTETELELIEKAREELYAELANLDPRTISISKVQVLNTLVEDHRDDTD
jgi:hypothetical protein